MNTDERNQKKLKILKEIGDDLNRAAILIDYHTESLIDFGIHHPRKLQAVLQEIQDYFDGVSEVLAIMEGESP